MPVVFAWEFGENQINHWESCALRTSFPLQVVAAETLRRAWEYRGNTSWKLPVPMQSTATILDRFSAF